MPKVSVIMGIYNCASTLQEALDSLYSQTFRDFEIVMCDDGSSDNTLSVAQSNANAHDNIVLLRNETNLGLNKTLNRCLKVAKGEYIARMDGDDISLPERFTKEVDFLDAHPEYAIVSTQMIFFDSEGEFMRSSGGDEPTKEALNYGTPFCHAPCMVRKIAYEAVGGYSEDKRLLRVEDYNLWTKMFAAGYRGYNLPDCLYAMRDDRKAAKRRTFKSRLNGIYAHYIAYKTLHLSLAWLCYDVLISGVKSIIPQSLYVHLHRKR